MRDPSRPLVRPILVLLVAASVASLPASSADADRSLAAEPPPVLPELERTVTDARRQATELLRKNMEALDDIELEAVAIFAAIVAANSTANSSASSLPLKHDHKALLLPSCSDLSFASTLCNTIVSGIISARDAAISAKNAAVTLVNNARSSFTTKVTAFKRKIDTFESNIDEVRTDIASLPNVLKREVSEAVDHISSLDGCNILTKAATDINSALPTVRTRSRVDAPLPRTSRDPDPPPHAHTTRTHTQPPPPSPPPSHIMNITFR